MRQALQIKGDYTNILLDMAAQRTRERGDRAYEKHLGVSLRDIRLLRLIGSTPGVIMSSLSEQTGIEKTLASKLIASLVKRGWVKKHIGREDARQVQLELTESGKKLVLRAEPLGTFLERGFGLLLSDAEIKTLRKLLQKVVDAERSTRDQFETWLSSDADFKQG
jgi:DNA-binding MarR family transcriptional regulator